MYRQGRFRTWKKPKECLCTHLPLAHYRDINGAPTMGCRLCQCKKFCEAPRPSKYHAKKQEFNGVRYDSKFEAKVAADLEYQLKCGEIAGIERQVDFPFIINGKRVGRFVYRADFLVTHKDGSKEIIEAKGMRLPIFNLKWELMQVCYPEMKFTLRTQ